MARNLALVYHAHVENIDDDDDVHGSFATIRIESSYHKRAERRDPLDDTGIEQWRFALPVAALPALLDKLTDLNDGLEPDD